MQTFIVFILDDSLGFLVGAASVAMRRGLEEKLAARGLTAPQWAVLGRLWQQDGQPLSALGRSLLFDKPTISGIVDRLAAKRLVRRQADGVDGRVVRVRLLPAGRTLQPVLESYARDVNRQAARHLSAPELAALKAGLRRLCANLLRSATRSSATVRSR